MPTPETASSGIDLLHGLEDVESDHRISAERDVRGSNPHSRGTGKYRRNARFLPCIGLWPGQTGPIGIRVIAVRTTAGSSPLVVRGRHLTDSVALHATRGHGKTVAVGNPAAAARGSWPLCPLTPRLFAPRFRHPVGTLLTHGKTEVCARLSIRPAGDAHSRPQTPAFLPHPSRLRACLGTPRRRLRRRPRRPASRL
ncbi:MAG: hypothetical protein ACI8UR_000862 [Natronomonas sp.]|jgi:hypothetical protein